LFLVPCFITDVSLKQVLAGSNEKHAGKIQFLSTQMLT